MKKKGLFPSVHTALFAQFPLSSISILLLCPYPCLSVTPFVSMPCKTGKAQTKNQNPLCLQRQQRHYCVAYFRGFNISLKGRARELTTCILHYKLNKLAHNRNTCVLCQISSLTLKVRYFMYVSMLQKPHIISKVLISLQFKGIL